MAAARVRLSVWDEYQKEWTSHYLADNDVVKGAEGDIIELRPEAPGAEVSVVPGFIEPFALGSIPAPAPTDVLLDAQGTPFYGRLRTSEPVYPVGAPNGNDGLPALEVDTPEESDVLAVDTNGSVGVNAVTLTVGVDSVFFNWDVSRWAKGDVFVGLNNSTYKVLDRDGNFKRYIANADYLQENAYGPIAPITTGCAANWHTGEVYMTNFSDVEPAVNVTTRQPGNGPIPYSDATRRLSTKILRSEDQQALIDFPGDDEWAYPIDANPESIAFDGNQNMYVGHSFPHFSLEDTFIMDANYTELEVDGTVVDELGEPVEFRVMGSSDPYDTASYGDISARLKTDVNGDLIFQETTFTWGSGPGESATLQLPQAFWEDYDTGAWLETSAGAGVPWAFRWPLGKRLHRYNATIGPSGAGTYSEPDRDIFWTFTNRQGTDWIDLSADQRTMFYTSEDQYIHRYDVVTGQQLPDFGGGRLTDALDSFHTLRILPPGDGTGGVLVANGSTRILRFDGDGNLQQEYFVTDDPDVVTHGDPDGIPKFWYSLEVDPGGTTFWASSHDTGYLYHFDLASGEMIDRKKAVEYVPLDDPIIPEGRRVEGICIMWEYTAAQEVCDDGIDNDGDGFIDESCTAIESCSLLSPGDDDGDGFADHNDTDCGAELPPTANDDSYATDEGVPLAIPAGGVVTNDTDPDNLVEDPLTNDILTVSLVGTDAGTLNVSNVGAAVATAGGGTVVLADNGSFLYTPGPGFHGVDTFVYQITDGAANSNTATVSVIVRPSVSDDAYTVNERTSLTVSGLGASPNGILVNDSSAPMTVTAAGAASPVALVAGEATFGTVNGGTVTILANGDFSYTPAVTFTGVDHFQYIGNDGVSDSFNVATVTITVADVNELIAHDDGVFSTPYETASSVNLQLNDEDPEGDSFQIIAIDGQPIVVGATVPVTNGSVRLDNLSGLITFTPASGYVGAVTFTYTIEDAPGGGADPVQSTATVQMDVETPPIHGVEDHYTTEQNSTLIVGGGSGILLNDLGAGALAVRSAGQPTAMTPLLGLPVVVPSEHAGGLVTVNPNGSFTYTPRLNFVGVDTFRYTIVDQNGAITNPIVVYITVTPISTTTVGTSPNPSVYGVAVPLTATVTCGPGPATAGTVTFLQGAVVLAANVPVVNGVAEATFPGTLDVGVYPVSAVYSGAPGQCPGSSGSSSHEVTPAPLLVTATPQTKVYGSTFLFAGTEFVVDGLVNGDTVTAATLTSVGAGAAATVGGSDYDIVPSAAVGSGLANYTISYAVGPMTVTPAPLTVTAANVSKTYGSTLTFAGTEFTTSGLLNGDTVSSVTLASAGSVSSATVTAGPYDISAGAASGTGLDNYTVTYADGTLTVTPRPVTVTAGSGSKVEDEADPALTTTQSGLLAGDEPLVALSTTREAGEAPGTYATTATASGDVLANYAVTYDDGTFVIDPKTLTVDASPVCIADAPYVNFTITADNFTPVSGATATLVWKDGQGQVVQTTVIPWDDVNQPLTGQVLWPGAVLDIEGNPVDWPGWLLQDGLWIQGSDGFENTRPVSTVEISVNPTTTVSVSYPPATPTCNAAPPANQPPVAVDDSASTDEDTPVTIAVLPNDSDPENGPLTVSVPSPNTAEGGTVAVQADGTVLYTPAANYCGVDSFTYTITDAAGLTDTATVTVNVSCVPDPATAVATGGTFQYTGAGHAGTCVVTGVFGEDLPGALTYAPGGTAAPVSVGSYVVNCDFAGNDDYTPVSATATIEIAPAPLVVTPTDKSKIEGAANPVLDGVGTGVVGGDNITWTYATTAGVTSPVGTYPITATLVDPNGRLSNYSVTLNVGTLTVLPANQPPVAVNDSKTTRGTTPVAIAVLGNDSDPDGDPLTVVPTGFTQPANGAVTLAGGVFTFVATPGFAGTTAFTYTISDGKGGTATATVTITVLPAQVCYVGTRAPQIGATQTWWNNPDGSITIRTTLSRNFNDNTYGANEVGWPGNNHKFKHLVTSDMIQIALFSNNGSRALEMKLDYFSESNAFPSGYGSNGPFGKDGGMVYGLLSNVVSADSSLAKNFNQYGYVLTTDSPATNSSYATNPTYPNWIWDAYYEVTVKASAFGPTGFGYPRIVTMHASPSKTGTETEPLAVVDCGGSQPPANRPPVATDNDYQTTSGQSLTVSGTGILGNDSDPDNDTIMVSTVNGSAVSVGQSVRLSHGNVTVQANGSLTYQPDNGFVGTETFVYQVTDGEVLSAPATVTIVVSEAPCGSGSGTSSSKSTKSGKSGASGSSKGSTKSSSKSSKSGKSGGSSCNDDGGHSSKSTKSGKSDTSSKSSKWGKSSKSWSKSSKYSKSSKSDHYDGDGDDHDRRRNGHYSGDGCTHDQSKSSKSSDGKSMKWEESDVNDSYGGDDDFWRGWRHYGVRVDLDERESDDESHHDGDKCDHEQKVNGHYDGDDCSHERAKHR